MSDMVTITIDGRECKARAGSMLIEVTDQNNIHVPRFCYHKHLSVAANCRMCMVEVEKAPKPLPACATPVADGMVVHTRSALALDAQRGTMEFLLINHPLDCPVCDQGGECELQDLAVGYGRDVSRYSENKRVVADKNIGPLVSTDMTRCIHCTRCIRFGQEIAGVRELGATGRGEFMEIGTFVEKSLRSELSGNVIDLCPVGALNAKPSRMQGRSWEMSQHPGVSPHDSAGSNLFLHVLRGEVMRVVPRENADINETWIADRDRFSYEGLHSDDRLTACMQKEDGHWHETAWDRALPELAKILRSYEPDEIGVLAGASQTNEELYLLQKIFRQLGVNNLDSRTNRLDFHDEQAETLFPWLGQEIVDLETQDAVFLIGSNIRFEQPILTHRLRKMARNQGRVLALNVRRMEWFIPGVAQLASAPQNWCRQLLEMLAALPAEIMNVCPDWLQRLVADITPSKQAAEFVRCLRDAARGSILLGELAFNHPQFTRLQILSYWLSKCTDCQFGFVPQAANRAGAALAGALPHRGVAGQSIVPGLNYRQMIESPRRLYICVGLDPQYDCILPDETLGALRQADEVIMLTPYVSRIMKEYASWLLPVNQFAENEGSYVNLEGRWQVFDAVVNGPKESKPLWKILRMLANALNLEGFDYQHCRQVREEFKGQLSDIGSFSNEIHMEWSAPFELSEPEESVWTATSMPIYSVDALTRHAESLQQAQSQAVASAYVHPTLASSIGIDEGDWIEVEQASSNIRIQCFIDDQIAPATLWLENAFWGAGVTHPQFTPVSELKRAMT